MKARRRFPMRAWLYTAVTVVILCPAITIVAQTIKGDSTTKKVDTASKWMPWDTVSPAKNPPKPLKSAVRRELNALYAEHGRKAPERSLPAATHTASRPAMRSTAKTVSRPGNKSASHAARRVGTIRLPKVDFSKLDVSKLELPKVEVPGFDVRGLVQNVFPKKLVPHGPVRAATVRRSKAAPLGQPKSIKMPRKVPGFHVRGLVQNVFPKKLVPHGPVRTATVRRSKVAPLGQPKHIEPPKSLKEPALAAKSVKAPSHHSKVLQAGGTTDQLRRKKPTTTKTRNHSGIQQAGHTEKTVQHGNHLHGPFHVVSPIYPRPLLSRNPVLHAISRLPMIVHNGIEQITYTRSLLPQLSSRSRKRPSATGHQMPSPVPSQVLPPRPTVITKRETHKADRKTVSSAKKTTIAKEQLASSVDGDSAGKIQTTSQETLASVKIAADKLDSSKASKSTAKASQEQKPNPPDKDADNPYQEQLRLIAERSAQNGLKGFCPVALRDDRDLKDAKPEFASVYHSHIYHFSSLEAKTTFDKSPKLYAPASNGNDVVLAAKTSESHEGALDHAVWFRNRLYLFTSKVTLDMFVASPRQYAVE